MPSSKTSKPYKTSTSSSKPILSRDRKHGCVTFMTEIIASLRIRWKQFVYGFSKKLLHRMPCYKIKARACLSQSNVFFTALNILASYDIVKVASCVAI